MTKPCLGKCYICCNEICEEEETCRLIYQEEIATPRVNKELDKAWLNTQKHTKELKE